MFYLWKDKRSTKNQTIVCITDYKEINKEGKVWTDIYGFIDAELLLASENKMDLIAFAQKLDN